jgi:hypothetical protein
MASLNNALRRLIFRLRGGVARAKQGNKVIETGLAHPAIPMTRSVIRTRRLASRRSLRKR